MEAWARVPAARRSSAIRSRSRGRLDHGAEGDGAVELADDLEQAVGELGGRGAGEEAAAELEVGAGALGLGEERVGGLVDAVVGEAVGAAIGLDQLEQEVLLDRGAQHGPEVRCRRRARARRRRRCRRGRRRAGGRPGWAGEREEPARASGRRGCR